MHSRLATTIILYACMYLFVMAEEKAEENPKHSGPFAGWHNAMVSIRSIGAFLVLMAAALPIGALFPRYLKLPSVTGYLIFGVVAGPYVTNLATAETVQLLSKSITSLALSFISFQAGQELYLPEIKPQLKGILQLLFTRFFVTIVMMSICMLAASPLFFYGELNGACQMSIAFLLGSIAVLVSPSTIMAIKIEMNSVGVFTNLMLGSVMLAEFVVLVAFSVARLLSSVYCAKLEVTFVNVLFTGALIISNAIVGVLFGGVIILIFTRISKSNAGEDHHHVLLDAALYIKAFLWISMGHIFTVCTTTISQYTVVEYGHSWDVKFEAMLVLMIASCVAGHYGHIRHEMHLILDKGAPFVFLPFFVITGCALKLDEVLEVIPMTSYYVIIRYLASFVACYLASRFFLGLPSNQANSLWLTMSPQAGVTLGLAAEIQAMSSDPWTTEFATTLVAAVIVNQILGPVMCSMGLRKAGECRPLTEIGDETVADEKDRMSHMSRRSSLKGGRRSIVNRHMSDPRLPDNITIFGRGQTALGIALKLTCSGVRALMPLLDVACAQKMDTISKSIWHTLSEKRKDNVALLPTEDPFASARDESEVLKRAARISDVIILVDPVEETLERVRLLTSPEISTQARIVAVVPDDFDTRMLRDRGVLVVQPSMATSTLAAELAVLDSKSRLPCVVSAELGEIHAMSTAILMSGRNLADAVVQISTDTANWTSNLLNHTGLQYARMHNHPDLLIPMHHIEPRTRPLPDRLGMFGTVYAPRSSMYDHYDYHDAALDPHLPILEHRRGDEYRLSTDSPYEGGEKNLAAKKNGDVWGL